MPHRGSGPVKANPNVQLLAINGNAGTELSVVFPEGTTAFTIKSRTDIDYRAAWVATETGGAVPLITDLFMTKDGSIEWYEDGLTLNSGKQLYVKSDTAGGHTLEIMTWQ